MKRIFALILVLAMLVPLAVACNSDDETTTTTTTTTEIIDYDKFTSKDTVKKDWEGETLLIAATAWSANPSYPWSTMELVIEEGKTSGWARRLTRQFLKELHTSKQPTVLTLFGSGQVDIIPTMF